MCPELPHIIYLQANPQSVLFHPQKFFEGVKSCMLSLQTKTQSASRSGPISPESSSYLRGQQTSCLQWPQSCPPSLTFSPRSRCWTFPVHVRGLEGAWRYFTPLLHVQYPSSSSSSSASSTMTPLTIFLKNQRNKTSGCRENHAQKTLLFSFFF